MNISNRQRRLMFAAANDQTLADKVGIDQQQARQYVESVITDSQEGAVIRDLPPRIPDFVFLGGTTHGEDWRSSIETKFLVDAFNPIVEDWTEEAKRIEDRAKEAAMFQLYVITPEMCGIFSIAELTESAVTYPAGTVVVFLTESGGKTWDDHQVKSNQAVCDLVAKHGAKVLNTLDEAVEHINACVTMVHEYEAKGGSLESFAGMASVAVSGAASSRFMADPESNAIRWIESHKTVDALLTIWDMLSVEKSNDEKSYLALKRLVRNAMLSIGYYLDNLEYANTYDDLKKILDQLLADLTQRVNQSWSPGMPGYGIQ